MADLSQLPWDKLHHNLQALEMFPYSTCAPSPTKKPQKTTNNSFPSHHFFFFFFCRSPHSYVLERIETDGADFLKLFREIKFGLPFWRIKLRMSFWVNTQPHSLWQLLVLILWPNLSGSGEKTRASWAIMFSILKEFGITLQRYHFDSFSIWSQRILKFGSYG